MEKLDNYFLGLTAFGTWIDVEYPSDSDVVIVCSNDGYGLHPERLLLRGQVYMKDWKDTPGLTLIPVRSKEYIHLGATGSGTSGVKNRTLAEREAV